MGSWLASSCVSEYTPCPSTRMRMLTCVGGMGSDDLLEDILEVEGEGATAEE